MTGHSSRVPSSGIRAGSRIRSVESPAARPVGAGAAGDRPDADSAAVPKPPPSRLAIGG